MTSIFHAPRASFSTRILGVAALVLAGAAGLRAADWQSLITNTPFGQSAPAAAGASGDLEFRGVVQEDSGYLINLYNPTTKTSQWLPVKGTAPGLEVKSYDAGSDKVSITQAGRPLTLPLKQAKVTLLAATPVPAGAEKPGADGPDGAPGDRRAEIRDMIRARLEKGGPDVQALTRTLPPDAQAMIEEFRRRRAEARAGDNTAQPADQGQQPAQGQGQVRRQRQQP